MRGAQQTTTKIDEGRHAMAKTYCQVIGIVLLVLGVVGLFRPSLLGAPTTLVHNLIHLISGAVLAYFAFTGGPVKMGAQVFGVIYTIVGVLGFISAGTLAGLSVPTNTLYNLIHLVVGVAGLYAGFGIQEMAKA
jgi:uncharacterized membrane protein HdeD (DUF308 family)